MYRFRKSQRICSLKEMNNLFERDNNSAAQAFPLRAVFRIYTNQEQPKGTTEQQKDNLKHQNDTPEPQKIAQEQQKDTAEQQKDNQQLKVLISVGKKHFHHAVDRNRAKRQIREAWRLQSPALSLLAKQRHLSVHIAFIWQSNKPMASKTIQGAMHRLLTAIEVSITKKEHKL